MIRSCRSLSQRSFAIISRASKTIILGAEAKKLYDEAQAMLNEMMATGSLKSRGIVGFYPANAVGDDIHIYDDEDQKTSRCILHGLRQQAEIEAQTHYQCISDFVAPLETGKKDYVGMFAVSSGFGCDELCAM